MPWAPLAVAGLVLGVSSLLIARPLGYDAWSWMVWAREAAHGVLQTRGGPAFKPLPVIVAAPLTPFGDLAPFAWLAAMRVCALLALVVAYRAGSRIGGVVAGVAAAALIAVGPDLFRTAVYGSAEPLLVLLVLLAADRYLAGSSRTAIVLLGVAGLIRPELWPVVLALAAAAMVRERRLDWGLVAATVVPPVVWLGMSRAGGGPSTGQLIHAARTDTICVRCALVAPLLHALVRFSPPTDAAGVLQRLTGAIVLPAIALSAVGIAASARRRLTEPLVTAGVACAWIAIVAVMAQLGYPGSRRYLVGPAALLALLAGGGLAIAVGPAQGNRARTAITATIAVLVLVSSYPTIHSDAALLSTAREETRTQADLRSAVRVAGGRKAILAAGLPAINPLMQTALAWDLRLPLTSVQATWSSTVRRPRWTPPAIVFSGPEHYAGPPPALPPGRRVTPIGRAGGWTTLRS
ncbi:MAG: hypothetical protein U0R68_18055 [Candidatus Nanopelagicales bacterium]